MTARRIFTIGYEGATQPELIAALRQAGVERLIDVRAVASSRGNENIVHLDKVGLTGPDVCLAHCVWLSDSEKELLRDTGTHVLHCPSSNMKLASGYAPIPELLAAGIKVSLGADGAPCNNNLDAFMEMRDERSG